MKDDYLWDGSGEPDPEVQKLENLLGRYRHDQPAPAFEQIAVEQPALRGWRFAGFRLSFQIAAVAAVLVIGIAAYVVNPKIVAEGDISNRIDQCSKSLRIYTRPEDAVLERDVVAAMG